MLKLLKSMLGGKKKEKKVEQDEERYCHCGRPDSCPQYGPYRLQQYNRP